MKYMNWVLITLMLFSINMSDVYGYMNLPSVNLSRHGVSAREIFGESIPLKEQNNEIVKKNIEEIKVNNTANNSVVFDKKNNDILIPKKPVRDLWIASNRDNLLKEKNILVASNNTEEKEQNRPKTDLDKKIEQLIELQKQTDERLSNFIKNRNQIVKVVVPQDNNIIKSSNLNKKRNVYEKNEDFDMTKMSPMELKNAFKKTYLSENKHLSTFQVDEKFDVVSDLTQTDEFTAKQDLSERGGIRSLEIKISFDDEDSSLSRDNYNLLSEYASIVLLNPKRAVQISIPEKSISSLDNRKLAAKRLAVVEQVLHDIGVSEKRIMPVLNQKNDDAFTLRIISKEQYNTLVQEKKDMFGDTINKKTYKSMSW